MRQRNPPRHASATKAPASPAFPAVVTAAASAAVSETSRRRRHESRGKPLRPPPPKFKPAYFVRVSCRKFKIVVNLDFLGCQHWNEQLRFFKILEYTGRYRFPEILIEVRAAFLELALRKNVRRMFAECSKSEEKTSHRFGIVVLKTGLSVSRPIENSGVEWV